MVDNYDKVGCCLTCDHSDGDDCSCGTAHICSSCDWYEYNEYEMKGECSYPRDNSKCWKTWEDYEEEAEETKRQVLSTYGFEPHGFSALFSNGTDEKTVYYVYAKDIPSKISTWLSSGKWRTLLLKEVSLQTNIYLNTQVLIR